MVSIFWPLKLRCFRKTKTFKLNKVKQNLWDTECIIFTHRKLILICVNSVCDEMSHFLVQPGVGSVPSATTTITSTPMHMCQPLLDAVATNMKSPMFNHALQQTFGPAMTALFGAPIRYNTIFRSDRWSIDLIKSFYF